MLHSNSLSAVWTDTFDNGTTYSVPMPYGAEATSLLAKNSAKLLDRLESKDCLSTYATIFPTTRSSLILVTAGNGSNVAPPFNYNNALETIDKGSCEITPYEWICSGSTIRNCFDSHTCEATLSSIDPSNWTPFGQKVEYCLSDTF